MCSKRPKTSPTCASQVSRARRAQLISRICLRQIRGGTAQDFVLLLEQARPRPQLGRFVSGLTGFVTGIDVCSAQPFRDGAFVDTEVLGDLGERGLLVTVQSHT